MLCDLEEESLSVFGFVCCSDLIVCFLVFVGDICREIC